MKERSAPKLSVAFSLFRRLDMTDFGPKRTGAPRGKSALARRLEAGGTVPRRSSQRDSSKAKQAAKACDSSDEEIDFAAEKERLERARAARARRVHTLPMIYIF